MTRIDDKLVRDRVPEIVVENGERPITRTATGEEYGDLLASKLVEEATEFEADRSPEELADVLAVFDAICSHRGIDRADVERLAAKKAASRGGFADGIVLERVEDSNPWK